ncbi:MAG: GTPase domain-containing protein [Alphaproteobacteria bacterium]|nr:GTPase domain-containing protein [Alphaproteobacteria bacterium]
MAEDHHSSEAGEIAETSPVSEQAKAVAPVVWLIGKVQAGKSSIIGTLTGTSKAEVGSGYRACTKTAKIFDFPEDMPLIRFLDTRGLGEARYDAGEDIEVARGASHCAVAVMRAMDAQQDAVLRVLSEIRKKDGNWPVVIAQTHLHEGYRPQGEHPLPYPYTYTMGSGVQVAQETLTDCVPPALLAALEAQREMFSKLPGSGPIEFAAIDFTKPEDGYHPRDYGRHALEVALAEAGSSALGAALADIGGDRTAEGRSGDLHRLIVGYASAAAAADLVPVAAVAAVPAVQAKLLHALSQKHGLEWNRRMSLEFAGALGAGALTRYAAGFGIRQLVKLIPAYGQTVGATAAAAASFATTFALGKAADYYLKRTLRGGQASTAEIKEVWARSLSEAFDLANRRGLNDGGRTEA